MAPTLANSYYVDSAGSNTTSLVTPSFTPAVGEILVVKRITWGETQPYTAAPSGASLTYTARVTAAFSTTCWLQISTATVASASSMTVTGGSSAAASRHSMCVERWANAQLAGTPATNSGNGNTAPLVNLTTVAANSVVSWCSGDWNGGSPTGRVYRSSATDEGVTFFSGDTTQYYAWQAAASAGSQAMGMTVPATQLWSLAGIEIQDASAAGYPFELFTPTPRYY